MWNRLSEDTKGLVTLFAAVFAGTVALLATKSLLGETGGDVVLGLVSCGIVLHLAVFGNPEFRRNLKRDYTRKDD